MDLTRPIKVCKDLSFGKRVSKDRARAALVALYVAQQFPDKPSEKQIPVLKAIVKLRDAATDQGPSIQDIADEVGVAYSSCHEAIGILERKRLVERHGGPAKRRNLHPTDFGRECAE